MKIAFSFVLTAAAVVASSLLTATPAAAQAFTAAGQGNSCDPQKTNTSGAYTSTGSSAFGQVACSSSGLSVTLQAWTAYTNAQTGFVQGNLGDFNGAGFGAYTGINEQNNPGAQHAFDNITAGCGTVSNAGLGHSSATTAGGGTAALALPVAASGNNNGCGGAVEALFMNFGTSKVKLSSLTTGFTTGDGDLSIYVWTGGGTGPTMGTQAISNNASTGLTGWSLVGSNDMDITNPFNTAGANSNLYSSYFLVTTYFGATSGNFDAGNDTFKINGWTANVCTGTVNASGACGTTGVPEPGSLALAGLALVGVFASRRKVKALF